MNKVTVENCEAGMVITFEGKFGERIKDKKIVKLQKFLGEKYFNVEINASTNKMFQICFQC